MNTELPEHVQPVYGDKFNTGEIEKSMVTTFHYQVTVDYLIEERKAYDVQLKSFETEIQHIWELLEVIYQELGISAPKNQPNRPGFAMTTALF